MRFQLRTLLLLFLTCTIPVPALAAEPQPTAVTELATHLLQQPDLAGVVAVDLRLTDWLAAGYPLTEPEF